MRRRIAMVLLPLLAFLLWMRPRAGVERGLAVRFGVTAASVRGVDLHFRRAGDEEGAILRDVSLTFPEGAKEIEHRRVMLPDGDYEIGARVAYVGGRAVGLTKRVHVGGDESIGVDLEVR